MYSGASPFNVFSISLQLLSVLRPSSNPPIPPWFLAVDVGEQCEPCRAPPSGLAAGAGRSAHRTPGQGCAGSGRDACWPPGQGRATGPVAVASRAVRRPPRQALLLGCEATRAPSAPTRRVQWWLQQLASPCRALFRGKFSRSDSLAVVIFLIIIYSGTRDGERFSISR